MVRRALVVASLLAVAVAVAQAPPPPVPMGGLMIPLPEGMMPPPPEDGPEAFEEFVGEVFANIAGDDGVMTLDELKAWLRRFGPHPAEGEEGGMEPGEWPCGMEFPAEVPRADCDGITGNLIERVVCNGPEYAWQAISMPAGRNAGCFNVAAKSASTVIFYIYNEADPSAYLFDSDRDGLHNIGTVMGTLSHDADTVYHVELDQARSAPDAWVKVTCVDYPE